MFIIITLVAIFVASAASASAVDAGSATLSQLTPSVTLFLCFALLYTFFIQH